jgi:gamma-D-glutamyl-L-lysine dipeptidyl-peptidase
VEGLWVIVQTFVLVLLASAGQPASPVAGPAQAQLRWVDVPAATLWVEPGQARAVDTRAVADGADPSAWVRGMSVAEKHWLVGRLETQALYAAPVRVLETSGSWSRVVVPGQPTPRDARGYPGWVPAAQLTRTAPQPALFTATVRRPTAWAFATPGLDRRVLELSYGTRLPAFAWTPDYAEVILLGGQHAYLPRAAVSVAPAGARPTRVTGEQLVAEARKFLGLQYLWAGASGFGVDCSGFTYLVHRELGITIPRDAGPQAEKGRRVASREALRPGDLVFFATASGDVHHVAMYVGDGVMIHAPATGRPVSLAALADEPYASEYAGARRYAR